VESAQKLALPLTLMICISCLTFRAVPLWTNTSRLSGSPDYCQRFIILKFVLKQYCCQV